MIPSDTPDGTPGCEICSPSHEAELVSDLLNALRMMDHAFGAFASTPKANRCCPTRREINAAQRSARDAARSAIAKATGGKPAVLAAPGCSGGVK